MQEVFERVWRGSGHDERRGPLGPYLKLLARSRALDLWRRTRSAERVQHRLEEQADSLARPAYSPGDGAHPRRRAPARARRGAAPARRAAPGDRARLLGRPVRAGAGRGRGHSPRHGEEPRPPGARASCPATPSWRPHEHRRPDPGRRARHRDDPRADASGSSRTGSRATGSCSTCARWPSWTATRWACIVGAHADSATEGWTLSHPRRGAAGPAPARAHRGGEPAPARAPHRRIAVAVSPSVRGTVPLARTSRYRNRHLCFYCEVT